MNGNVANIIAASITGEWWLAKDTNQQRPARNEIALLAYHRYEVRGRQDGHDIEDWLRAEEELAHAAAITRVKHAKS